MFITIVIFLLVMAWLVNWKLVHDREQKEIFSRIFGIDPYNLDLSKVRRKVGKELRRRTNLVSSDGRHIWALDYFTQARNLAIQFGFNSRNGYDYL